MHCISVHVFAFVVFFLHFLRNRTHISSITNESQQQYSHGHELWVTFYFYFYFRICIQCTERDNNFKRLLIISKESRFRMSDNNNMAVHLKWTVWMLSQSLIKLDQSISIEMLNNNSSRGSSSCGSSSKIVFVTCCPGSFSIVSNSLVNSTYKFLVIRMMWWFARCFIYHQIPNTQINIYNRCLMYMYCIFLPTRAESGIYGIFVFFVDFYCIRTVENGYINIYKLISKT